MFKITRDNILSGRGHVSSIFGQVLFDVSADFENFVYAFVLILFSQYIIKKVNMYIYSTYNYGQNLKALNFKVCISSLIILLRCFHFTIIYSISIISIIL